MKQAFGITVLCALLMGCASQADLDAAQTAATTAQARADTLAEVLSNVSRQTGISETGVMMFGIVAISVVALTLAAFVVILFWNLTNQRHERAMAQMQPMPVQVVAPYDWYPQLRGGISAPQLAQPPAPRNDAPYVVYARPGDSRMDAINELMQLAGVSAGTAYDMLTTGRAQIKQIGAANYPQLGSGQ